MTQAKKVSLPTPTSGYLDCDGVFHNSYTDAMCANLARVLSMSGVFEPGDAWLPEKIGAALLDKREEIRLMLDEWEAVAGSPARSQALFSKHMEYDTEGRYVDPIERGVK